MLQTLHDNPAFCQILLYLQDRQRGLQATALNSLPASPSSEDNKAGEDGLAFIVNHFAQIGEARAASIAELLFFNLYEQLNQELKEKKDAGNKSE